MGYNVIQFFRSGTSEIHKKPRRGKKRNASPILDETILQRKQKTSRLDDQFSKTRERNLDDEDTDEDNRLTEDEMSVNTINKNKAKLFSHILNPKNKVKSKDWENKKSTKNDESDIKERVKTVEGAMSAKKDKNSFGKVQPTTSPTGKKIGLQNSSNAKEGTINTSSTPGKKGGRKQPQSVEFVATTDEEEDEEEESEAKKIYTKPKSDLSKSREGSKHIKENIRPHQAAEEDAEVGVRNRKMEKNMMTYNRKSRTNASSTKASAKEISAKDTNENEDENGESTMEDLSAPDLVTVNMDDLTDLLTSNKSTNKRNSRQQKKEDDDEARQVFFARKSEPNKNLKTSQSSSRLGGSMSQKLNMSSNNENSSENESSSAAFASQMSNKGSKIRNKSNPTENASNNVCHLCDRTFKIKTNLQLHLEKVPTVVRLQ